LSLGALPAASLGQASAPLNLPLEVAGITLPRSRVAIAAANFSRNACPDFLFNHCMRTYVFGALALHRQKLSYNADLAFVAASLHDLGLLPAFESPKLSFEIDGANAAERFVRSAGSSVADANSVWFDVALHDGRFAITRRMGPGAMLVALGAASDVDGPDLDTEDEKKQMAEIVAAFPRLQFKHKLTSLLIDHCKRKPTSQRGTWLEGLCREQVPSAWTDTVEKEIAGSPFAE
jgi:hypothetical protein